MTTAAQQSVYRASTTAPVNIAVIKYWGKRDPILNLPTNSSLSVTLSQSSLRAHTTASCSLIYPIDEGDTLLLNGTPEPIRSSARTQACLSHLRRLRASLESADPDLPKLSTYPLRLVSSNNFPTAAGLASSAAGFAALVRAVADLYSLPHTPAQLSLIARQGSGSACRSLMGGYVAWRAGSNADGTDSVAEEIAPASHWPQMRALILVVSAAKKGVASTAGMQVTVKTSQLFERRAQIVVPRQMEAVETAIRNRDFESFANITMRESNSFHAVCLDSWPPIHYLNDVSRAVMRIVEGINEKSGRLVAAYTFDAGPNAVVYYLEEEAERVAGTFRSILGQGVEGWERGYGERIPVGDYDGLDEKAVEMLKGGGVSRVMCTGVGPGPEKVHTHLLSETGEPLAA